MQMTNLNSRFFRLWAIAAIAGALGVAALLQAQAKPEQPGPTTQPATTQPAGPEGPKTPTTQPVKDAEGKQAAKAGTEPEKAAPGGRKPKPKAVDPEPPREPSPSEVLRELTKQSGVRRPVVSPVAPGRVEQRVVSGEAVPPNAILPPTQRLLPDGYRIVDRPGRLARDGDYWVFSFENRGQGAPELPIRLLPNRLLEDMERASAGGTKPMVFVISGEVTEYHNVNYVLLQKLLVQPDLGNLK